MRTFTFSATFLANIGCGRKGHYAHNLRITQIDRASFYDYGEVMHYGLKHYYSGQIEGLSKSASKDKAVDELRLYYPKVQMPVAECEDLIRNFVEYCKYWENDGWTPLRVEEPFLTVIYEDEDFEFTDEHKGIRLALEGIIDLEVQTANEEKTIVDHKTVSRNREPEKLSYQFMSYALAHTKSKLVINDIGKQKTLKAPERFHRHLKFYSEDLLEEFKQETILKVLRWIRDDESGLYIPDFTSCDKYGGCTFRKICENSPRMREQIIRNYYKVREKYSPFDDVKEVTNG